MTTEQTKPRNIGIDFYKILCSFFITMIHLLGYSNLLASADITKSNFVFAGLIEAASIIGVNGFVLISGYYLSANPKNAERPVVVKRIVSFLLRVEFISILIFIVSFCIFREIKLSVLFKSVFPVLGQHYWYVFNYLVLLIFMPYLNRFINAVSRSELKRLLLCIILIGGVFLKLDIFYDSEVFLGHASHGILWFVTLYLSAGYLRKYGVKNWVLCGPVLLLISFVLLAANVFLKVRFPVVEQLGLGNENSVLGWTATVSSFVLFQRMNKEVSKKANSFLKFVASATFIVYLFQEHEAVRSHLWRFIDVLRFANAPTYTLLLVIAGTFLGILAVSMVIEALYLGAKKIVLDKLTNAVVQKAEQIGEKYALGKK